jgi:hypothetical protein
MTPPVACVMCLIGPEAQQFAVPLAQATVIVAPVLLRDRIRNVWRFVRSLRQGPRKRRWRPVRPRNPAALN